MTSPLEHVGDGPAGPSPVPTPDLAATAVSIACPGCRRLVPVGAPCPSCGRAAAPPAVTRDLTVVLDPAQDATLEMDPVPPAAPVPPAQPLRPAETVPPAATPPAGLPPVASSSFFAPVPHAAPDPALIPRSRTSRGRTAGVLGGTAALVLVAAAAVAGLHSGSAGADRTAPAGSAQPPGGDAVIVPATSVRAAASSTQHPDGAISYAPANTLDGRAATAWNSDGQGAGAALTYTFAAPVDLTSITVLNGYQKTLKASNGATVDLFALNQRVKALRVVTDGGSVAWTLRDDRVPQTLTRAFGRTRTVRLQVVSTYPSRKYKDLAVSEVRFTARG